MNPYEVLGVDRNASQQEIKSAFRKKASELHPDKNLDGEDSTALFQLIQQAYAILKDAKKRQRYDDTGETESRENSIASQSESLVFSCLFEIMEENDFEPLDYVKEIKGYIRSQLDTTKAKHSRLKKQAANLAKLSKRISSSNETLEAFIVHKAKRIEKRISAAEYDIDLLQQSMSVANTIKMSGSTPRRKKSSEQTLREALGL